jgi:hypothetical protein
MEPTSNSTTAPSFAAGILKHRPEARLVRQFSVGNQIGPGSALREPACTLLSAGGAPGFSHQVY